MLRDRIIRAWKDPEYRTALSEEDRAELPENPAGAIELTDEELDLATGGQYSAGLSPYSSSANSASARPSSARPSSSNPSNSGRPSSYSSNSSARPSGPPSYMRRPMSSRRPSYPSQSWQRRGSNSTSWR